MITRVRIQFLVIKPSEENKMIARQKELSGRDNGEQAKVESNESTPVKKPYHTPVFREIPREEGRKIFDESGNEISEPDQS